MDKNNKLKSKLNETTLIHSKQAKVLDKVPDPRGRIGRQLDDDLNNG